MKKVLYVIGVILLAIVLLLVLTGCTSKQEENKVKLRTVDSTTGNSSNYNYAEAAEKQMAEPEIGETVAIIKVKGFGEMKFKFFPEVAPKAVENFTTHAKEGYYDGLKFHRVMEDFMIQGGDPDGDGTGGESIWGEGFGTELDKYLVPYRGSLCMAMSSKPNSIGSQFFITQAKYDEESYNYLSRNGYPAGLLEQYKKYGGYLSLYMQYTVFGQIYEGLDVLDQIVSVEKTYSSAGELSVPVKDVIIDTIEVTTYSK